MSATSKTRLFLYLVLVIVWPTAASGQANPHWNESACQSCHVTVEPIPGQAALERHPVEELCSSCHVGSSSGAACRHLSAVRSDPEVTGEAFKPFLTDGKLTCTTCHDLKFQCMNPQAHSSLVNPGFLRNRESRRTGDYCMQCHESDGLEALNPHETVVAAEPGRSCPICHLDMRVSKEGNSASANVELQRHLNDTCLGCHQVQAHPKGFFSASNADWDHLVVPSEEVRQNMLQWQVEAGVSLPLSSYDGAVYCATCHEPHGSGVERGSESRPARPGYRLRAQNLCQACHKK